MDRRDYSLQVLKDFDPKRMWAYFDDGEEEELIVVRCRYVVCDVCEGKGTHVNPNIDRNGLSADDFAEDPDFAESYCAGVYDVPCRECGGQRVVPEADPDQNSPALLKKIANAIEGRYADVAESAAERRYCGDY